MSATPSQADHPEMLHASFVAFRGAGALIMGPSGSGKSALTLRLMSYGADLVSDDRTIVHRKDAQIMGRAPDAIRGQIEARGIGILTAETIAQAQVSLVVDMSKLSTARLPDPQTHPVLGVSLPCLHKVDAFYFPDAVLLYLKGCISHAT